MPVLKVLDAHPVVAFLEDEPGADQVRGCCFGLKQARSDWP